MDYNWSKVLPAGEKLTGEPLVFNKAAYFTTYSVDLASACDAGSGTLYGVHYTNQDPAGTVIDNTEPALDVDGDPSTIDTSKSLDLGNTVPFGVQIVERPTCIPGITDSAAPAGNDGAAGSKRGKLQLVINASQGSAYSADQVPPNVDPAALRTKTITHQIAEYGETLQSAAWGYILY